MEYPWEVVGWEKTISEKGTEGCRLYLQQPIAGGVDGEGFACGRVWFSPNEVEYSPVLGHKVIVISDDRNRNIVRRIIVVG